MEIVDFTPLGFSDLTDDEAFVVSVFRHWQSSGASHKDAETSLAEVLRNDRLYGGLQSLFDLFGTLPVQHSRRTKNESAVLSSIEESLLKEVGSTEIRQKRCVKIFQRILKEKGATIRRTSEIPRSGHDHLVEVIERKSAKVYGFIS